MYAEGTLPAGYRSALDRAIRKDALISVRSLSGYSGDPEQDQDDGKEDKRNPSRPACAPCRHRGPGRGFDRGNQKLCPMLT